LNSSQGSVLVVDNDEAICRALQTTLQALGFDVASTPTGEEALMLLRTAAYDIVLLDINMPGMGGIEACRTIRRLFPTLAILMLTVRDSLDDKVNALEAGADDYVTKPFHVRELTARIQALFRRIERLDNAVIRVHDMALDPVRRELHKAGLDIHLTPKEFDLLHYLMAHAGLPITHSRLLGAVWGPEYRGDVEYLRTFIRQLRKKIEDDPMEPKYLLTDIQIGYRFRQADSVSKLGPSEAGFTSVEQSGGIL
jgi:two-component system KDP operon response regulator KdpE